MAALSILTLKLGSEEKDRSRSAAHEGDCHIAAAFQRDHLLGTKAVPDGIDLASLDDGRITLKAEAMETFAQRVGVAIAWTQFFGACVAS